MKKTHPKSYFVQFNETSKYADRVLESGSNLVVLQIEVYPALSHNVLAEVIDKNEYTIKETEF